MSADEVMDIGPEPELHEARTLARRDRLVRRDSVLLMPVMDVPTALARLEEFQSFCARYLQESADGGQDGGDYGVIPGTKKKTLLKSGAEKLCEIYGLADEYEILSKVEDWQSGLFDYTLKCVLRSRRDDSFVGSGVGSCSTFESKYRWREQQKTCPSCGIAAIIKGKDFKNDGRPTGWLCWAKKGGCGQTYKDGDAAIEGQPVGRIENPDIIDQKNTALKMAKKRAKIDAVIGVTRSSGIFTQDLDDVAQNAPAPAPAAKPAPAPVRAPERQPAAQTASPAVLDTELPPAPVISEAQAKRLFAISRSAGWTTEALKGWLLTKGIFSTKAITKADYEGICKAVEAGPDTRNQMVDADQIAF